MVLSSLELHDFRSYARLDVAFPPEGAVLYGCNGAGKTNVLEAVHMAALGRSQRNARRTEMIRHEAEAAHIGAAFRDETTESTSSFGFDRGGNVSVRIDGRRAESVAEWFGRCPVVAFGPDDLQLIRGGPALRRRFLDMLISQTDPAYLESLTVYHRSLRNRNRLLGDGRPDETLLELYESEMTEAGAAVHVRRANALVFCQEFVAKYYADISGEKERGDLRFCPSTGEADTSAETWKDVFFKTLKNKRKRDLERGYTSSGPHRDDILFLLDRKPAKTYGSQGQCRSLALALKLASVRCIERRRKCSMLFLVDDAFSELDATRVRAVFPLIRSRGQVFMATPNEHDSSETDLKRYTVADGLVTPA